MAVTGQMGFICPVSRLRPSCDSATDARGARSGSGSNGGLGSDCLDLGRGVDSRAWETDESVRHLQTAVALRPNDGNTLYNAACTYGVLNRKAEALETLKKALAAGYGNLNWAARDSDLDCLHDNPEFQKLVGLDETPAA